MKVSLITGERPEGVPAYRCIPYLYEVRLLNCVEADEENGYALLLQMADDGVTIRRFPGPCACPPGEHYKRLTPPYDGCTRVFRVTGRVHVSVIDPTDTT